MASGVSPLALEPMLVRGTLDAGRDHHWLYFMFLF
jgi:hypothetical protein